MKTKMKRMLSWLAALVLVLGMVPVSVLAAEPAQNGGIYQIGTAADLLWFAQEVNAGGTGIKGKLTADIDLSTVSDWPGIGTSARPFAGSLDGQGYTVTFKDAPVGLFGYIKGSSASLAAVQNVVTAGSIRNPGFAISAGFARFTLCINRATITTTGGCAAGLVGSVIGDAPTGVLKTQVIFENCGNDASVSAGGGNVGGILGYSMANTQLNSCYNKGNIHGSFHVGGLVGYLQESSGTCSINNSYNTGTITGTSEVGGIIGNMYNGVSVSGCYNAGSAFYAIAGSRYNSTATITNSYFMGVKSAKVSPDYNVTQNYNELTTEIQTRAASRSAAYMATADFASELGSAFKQSCPTPVLSWETAVSHTGSVCGNCALGSEEKEVYDVSFQSHNGYTISGEDTAEEGSSYSFTVAISAGYEKATDFTVKANGKALTPASNGQYTVLNVDGPLSITVLGVQVIADSYAVNLPGEGYGYRVSGNKTVKRDEDYSFTISFVDGFKEGRNFKVAAQEVLSQELLDKGYTPEEVVLTRKNGKYTIPTVQKEYRILISGVEAVSKGVTATVRFDITEGHNEFHVDPKNENLMLDQSFTVPYFDLSLYGLERYYFNPYCYVDENGNIRSVQQKGTPESAYDRITVMHAFIVATELYYFGYSPAQVGKGRSYEANPTAFNKAISWSQAAGSSFMDFWDHGTNLNYYVNYEYPLAYDGWGSTSDQIEIRDGDVLSVHMITGNASGSRFGFFVVNDTDKKYTSADTTDSFAVDQGESVNLTLYWTSTTANYATGYEKMANKELYWISADEATEDVRDWERDGFGKMTAAKLVTDSKGTVTISTAGVEPGVYYLAALGGWTAGGAVDNGGFVSAGGETGPAVFKLTVNEYEGKLGDVNGDTQITNADATMIMRYVAKLTTEVNETTADVNGDGVVTNADATMIMRYVAKLIDSFPTGN